MVFVVVGLGAVHDEYGVRDEMGGFVRFFRLNRAPKLVRNFLSMSCQLREMDVSVREELSGLVEEMTHSGSPSLDHTQLKKLKKMCRSTD